MRGLYSLAWYLASPLIFLRLLLRGLRDPAWRGGWAERLGNRGFPRRGGIWIHAASVGEVQSAIPFVFALRMRHPDLTLTLTTFTPTGRDHARSHLPENVECRLLPFDLPGAPRRFLRKLNPRLGVVVETELWPNLFAACATRGLSLLMVSARLTEQSARAWRRWPRLAAAALAVPEVISTQTAADAARFQALGADPTRVTVGGNFKFDFRLPDLLDERIAALGEESGLSGRRVWIAASTHAGEEEQLLEAHAEVRKVYPDAVLVLAPRHPGRAPRVGELARARHLDCVSRSAKTAVDAGTAVFLVDTLGELSSFYGLAEVAFVGGSLVPVGGHNLLEPAAFGLPVLTGPNIGNVALMFDLLAAADAVELVADREAVAKSVTRLFADEPERRRRGGAANRVLEENRGAVDRAVRLVSGFV